MRSVLAVFMLFAWCGFAPAQWAITDTGPAGLVWVVTDAPQKLTVDEYQAKQAEAVSKGLPLAVFVGVPSRKVAGFVTVRVDNLVGVKGPAILVARPRAGGLVWEETLSATATDVRIRGEVRQVQPAPFDGSFPLQPQIADGDGLGRGLWPKEFEFPAGFERYKPAEYTQSIFTLNSSPTIQSVPRRSLLPKWHQPGGLEGVPRTRWSSETYKKTPGPAVAVQTRLPVKNSFGFYQQELGWTRQYPEGSQFMDVLSNRDTGQVFEIRLRTKEGGKWISEVDYRNRAHRPLGYRPVSVSECNGCHQEAGTGGYAVGLVPGSDTVLSDPFPALELGK